MVLALSRMGKAGGRTGGGEAAGSCRILALSLRHPSGEAEQAGGMYKPGVQEFWKDSCVLPAM